MKHPKNTLKLTEIRKKSKKLFGSEYTIQSRFFEDGIQKIRVKHNKCGRIKDVNAYGYLNYKGHGHCQFCNGGRPKMPLKEIQKIFYNLNNRKDWQLLDETEPYIYPSNGLKQRQFKIKHKKCGTIRVRQTNHIYKHPINCMECHLKQLQENNKGRKYARIKI